MFAFWGIYFFYFKLFESPKFLMGRGMDGAAVEAIHKVAKRNGKASTLTLDALQKIGRIDDIDGAKNPSLGVMKATMGIVNGKYLRPLFATRKLAWSTTLLIVLWGKKFRLVLITRLNVMNSTHRSCIPTVMLFSTCKCPESLICIPQIRLFYHLLVGNFPVFSWSLD